jgi:DUF4097 and DUF4098 domain-containing protein YvlB
MIARTFGAAAALIFGVASLGAAETRNIDKTLPLSAAGAVSLDTHNGSIAVRTWDRPQVEVHVRIESHGLSSVARYRLDDVKVDIDGTPDRVSIKTRWLDRSASSLWSLIGFSWMDTPELSYAIMAPRGARWQVDTHNAKAEIRDVNAPLQISTHNGAVRVVNLGGPIDLSMHNGYANVDFASFNQDSRINTHNGTVELALPASSRFNVDARGHHIHVASAFPVVTRTSDSARGDVAGSINGGGPSLHLTAHNGAFRISSK